jgi:hypothetical protein
MLALQIVCVRLVLESRALLRTEPQERGMPRSASRGPMIICPVRLQLSRRKGFNLQKLSRETNGLEAVNCSRPARWSNRWRIGEVLSWEIPLGGKGPLIEHKPPVIITREIAIQQFIIWIADCHAEIRKDLRGKNLACVCALSDPCHCDPLLEIANK